MADLDIPTEPISKKGATKTASKHPSTAEMVNVAIETLNDRGGSSLYAIKKYISAAYTLDVEKLSILIKKYLKSAVASGDIKQTKGIGANGSFKLSTTASQRKKAAAKKSKHVTGEPTGEEKPKAKKTSAEKKKPAAESKEKKKPAAESKEKKKPAAESKEKKKAPAKAASPKKAAKSPKQKSTKPNAAATKPKAPKPKKAASTAKMVTPKKVAKPKKK